MAKTATAKIHALRVSQPSTAAAQPLKEVVHKQSWELDNVRALLSGMLEIIEGLPESDPQWKLVRLVQMADQKLGDANHVLQSHI